MIIILGDFDPKEKELIIIILSKKAYPNTEILVSNTKSIIVDIYKKITRIVLNLKCVKLDDITIEFINLSNNKELERVSNLNLTKITSNVEIVNCDSTLGLEKNLWCKLKNTKSHYIFHCGDQIYNDKIFKNYYRYHSMNSSDIIKLDDEIFLNYYNQFKRYKNTLKNNLNLMIPDDHEIVDNTYDDKYKSDPKFIKIKSIFKKYVKKSN